MGGVQGRAARQHGPDRRAGRPGSKRWQRSAGRIARIHARAADLRRDALHQATTALARRHQVIVIEDLAVQNMTRRKPGAGRGGRGLNRALADAGLSELRRQLGYKTTWYGAEPPRRPRLAGQEARKRHPGTSPRWTRPGPPLRKERLPDHEHPNSLTRWQRCGNYRRVPVPR